MSTENGELEDFELDSDPALDAILDALERAGIGVEVDGSHNLILKPSSAVTPEILDGVREHKSDLVAHFRRLSVLFEADTLDGTIAERQAEVIGLQVDRALRRGFLLEPDEPTLEAYWKACAASGRIAVWAGKQGASSYFVEWNADALVDRARHEEYDFHRRHPEWDCSPDEDRYYRSLWPVPDLRPLHTLLKPCLERDDGYPDGDAEMVTTIELGTLRGLDNVPTWDALDIVVRYFRDLLPPPLDDPLFRDYRYPLTLAQVFDYRPELLEILAAMRRIARESEGKKTFCANGAWFGNGRDGTRRYWDTLFENAVGPSSRRDKIAAEHDWLRSYPAYRRVFEYLYNQLPDCRGCWCG